MKDKRCTNADLNVSNLPCTRVIYEGIDVRNKKAVSLCRLCCDPRQQVYIKLIKINNMFPFTSD